MHIWGHIHEDRGVLVDENPEVLGDGGTERQTVFVNAANAGTFERPRKWGTDGYQPIVVDLANDV